jgi:hypothetical protein
VTSWGSSPCGQPNTPGVYARVGAPALNAWVRSYVPTADVALSQATPAPGEQVSLGATVAPAQSGASTLAWDLDDDGLFDDATGAAAVATFASTGIHLVRVRATFADGDRAIAREDVDVGGTGLTATTTPEPVTTTPPTTTTTTTTVQQPAKTTPQPQPQLPVAAAPLGTVTVPERVKLGTLRGKSLRVRFRCERACTISGRLTLSAADARRVGLGSGRAAVKVGRGSSSLRSAGTGTLAIGLTTRAKRALRNRSRVAVRLTTELRSGTQRLASTQRITASR